MIEVTVQSSAIIQDIASLAVHKFPWNIVLKEEKKEEKLWWNFIWRWIVYIGENSTIYISQMDNFECENKCVHILSYAGKIENVIIALEE